jgi:protein-L-isoaspartate(D-aspartate) O-methyltransferase
MIEAGRAMLGGNDHVASDVDVTVADSLRAAMVEELRVMDGIRTDRVASAFRSVPRHLFVPGESLASAYAANASVLSKRDGHGVVISTVSAAHVQAVMLEQARLRVGMRVLEIGSGGYNAALIAELVGETGEVTTVDIDSEIVARARACLDEAGYSRVHTVLADADGGVGEFAPYDRVIVTVRSWDIPPAWVDQLALDGRLVVPLRLRGLTRTVVLDRVPGEAGIRLAGGDVRLCAFVPMQGVGAHDEHLVPIDEGRIRVQTEAAEFVDPEGLRDAVRGPVSTLWSGVEFDHVDDLDLWLAMSIPRFGMLTADQRVTDEGLLTAATLRGVPAWVSVGNLAYRTKREIPGTGTFETGVLAWGTEAAQLAERYVELIRQWGHHRGIHGRGPRVEVFPAATADQDLPTGRVLDKKHTRIVVSWS